MVIVAIATIIFKTFEKMGSAVYTLTTTVLLLS